jgi:hypothetical protein
VKKAEVASLVEAILSERGVNVNKEDSKLIEAKVDAEVELNSEKKSNLGQKRAEVKNDRSNGPGYGAQLFSALSSFVMNMPIEFAPSCHDSRASEDVSTEEEEEDDVSTTPGSIYFSRFADDASSVVSSIADTFSYAKKDDPLKYQYEQEECVKEKKRGTTHSPSNLRGKKKECRSIEKNSNSGVKESSNST